MSVPKQVLRERARHIRAGLPAETIAACSREICRKVMGLIDGESPVLVYASKSHEVNTHTLISRLLDQGTEVVVPIIETADRTLRLSYLRDPAVLRESTFSVPEPTGREIPADPAGIRLVIVPMMAFDRQGHRLGYGAGYYDRFLSRSPHMKRVGVAFSCQEVACIPADENDIRMDIIVTDKDIICISP